MPPQTPVSRHDWLALGALVRILQAGIGMTSPLRVHLVLLLCALIGCGHSRQLQYSARAMPQTITPSKAPVAPEELDTRLATAERVVIDLGPTCTKAKGSRQVARCSAIERALSRAIEDSGRSVILASKHVQPPLDLARDSGADLLLQAAPATLEWSDAESLPELRLLAPQSKKADELNSLCIPLLETALAKRQTHLQATMRARFVQGSSGRVLWEYEDQVSGEAGQPARKITATVESGDRRPLADGEEDCEQDRTTVVRESHHHHRDRSDDDDGDGDVAVLLLTILVVGIVILAVAAAANAERWCTVDAVEIAAGDDRSQHALVTAVEALLARRLGHVLHRKVPAS